MKLELPYPPSLNRLFRTVLIGVCSECRKHAHATLYKSQEYQDYATQLGVAMLEQQVQPFNSAALLDVRAHFYRPRKAGDLDNMFKALFDLMKRRVWSDDSQVAHIEAWRHDDKARPRVELEVTTLPAEQSLLDLGVAPASPPRPQERRTAPKPPPLPEPIAERVRRLARPAVVSNREDEPPW